MEWLKVETTGTAAAVEQAVAVLRKGGVVVFPAERLYGLAADARNREAIARVFALKGRKADQPLPVIIGESEQAGEWVEISGAARRLIEIFWPGPLTLVLPVKKELPREVTAGLGFLGIRVPGNFLARELLRAFGGPLTATSANPSGDEEGRTAESAVSRLAGPVDLVLDAGTLPGPPGSTVVKMINRKYEILRPGIIPADEIMRAMVAGNDR